MAKLARWRYVLSKKKRWIMSECVLTTQQLNSCQAKLYKSPQMREISSGVGEAANISQKLIACNRLQPALLRHMPMNGRERSFRGFESLTPLFDFFSPKCLGTLPFSDWENIVPVDCRMVFKQVNKCYLMSSRILLAFVQLYWAIASVLLLPTL